MKSTLLMFLFVNLLWTPIFAQTTTDCSIVHKGIFTYAGMTTSQIKIVIKGNKHTEYHQNGKYVIKSSLVWISDCEYQATLIKATLPNFKSKPGDKMNVKIVEVVGTMIHFTAYINGQKSWDGKLLKLK